MRYIQFVLSATLLVNGCKENSNGVAPIADQVLSVSTVIDSLQYTFAIPKDVFGIHDTLRASMTVLNISAASETLVVNFGGLSWTLKNDGGRTIMYGPGVSNNYRILEVLASHQSAVIGEVYERIADTSDKPVQLGSYVLSADSYLNHSISLSFNLSLQ